MTHFQIKRWDNDVVIYEGEAETLKDLVNTAVKSRADLSRANLSRAYLYGADLSRAYLSGANLYGANLYGANLYGANLYGANLSGANLSGAYLYGANLYGANLYGANLSGANLSGANLYGANLSGAKLNKGEILTLRVFYGLYKYTIHAYILKDGAMPCVKMGCLDFTLSEWEEKGGILKSNTSEFPDDGSAESMKRARAFNYAVAEALAMKAEIEAKK